MKDTCFLTFFVVHCWKEPCMHVLISKVGWDVGRTQREFHLDYMAFIMSKGFKLHLQCSFKHHLPLTRSASFVWVIFCAEPSPSPCHPCLSSLPRQGSNACIREDMGNRRGGSVFSSAERCTPKGHHKTKHHCQPLQASNSTHNMFFVQRGWFVCSSIEYWLTCFGFSWHVLCCWLSLLILC